MDDVTRASAARVAFSPDAPTIAALPPLELLRLLQLASPTLPVGAFAYSQGLEQAVEARWVHDEETSAAWILGLLTEVLTFVEVPLLLRLHAAFSTGDDPGARGWSDVLLASRGSAELQAEERRLGSALARLLVGLEVEEARRWAAAAADPPATYLAMFSLAGARWAIPAGVTAAGFLFSWAESQVGAACRLVPLGQTAGQRILWRAGALIPGAVARGGALDDHQIGAGAPGQAIASARHETQYSRIFRS